MKKAFALSLGVVLALVVALVLLGAPDRWPAVESPPRQGEALDVQALKIGQFSHSPVAISRLVREPQNTWSNLAFVFSGAYLAFLTSLRTSRLVGVAIVGVGIGSFIYHASASYTLRHMDVAAMYALFFALLMLAAVSLHARWSALIDAHVWLLATLALAFAAFATSSRNFVVFGVKPLALPAVTATTSGVLIGSLMLRAWRERTVRTAVRVGMAVSLFAGALVCQVGDRPGGWLLNPESIIQAHAVWHILAAAALFLAVQVLDVVPRQNKATEPTPRSVTTLAVAGVRTTD